MTYNTNCQVHYFSVLIPSYNRPEYITECIESILQNDFDDYEIIISDDNSPRAEDIKKAITPYLQFQNIHFFKQAKSLKEPGNKNFLVEQAKGQYTIIIGDDDKLYPYTLSKIKKYIDKYPDYDLYSFGYTIIDEDNRFYYSRHAPNAIEVNLRHQNLVEHLFISDIFPFWLYHPSTFCCRNGIEKEIPYSQDAGIGEDLLFLFDFINNGKRMFVIPESLFMWRKIQNKGTVGQKNQSLRDFSNVQARRNILYHLKKRKNLHPFISDVVSTFKYRKRFLYDSVIHDKAASNDNIDKLSLEHDHLKELERYYEKINCFTRFKPYIKRVVDFIELFGLRGLIQVCTVSLQRLGYKLKTVLR